MPSALAPVFAIAPIQQMLFLMRKSRELRKCLSGPSR